MTTLLVIAETFFHGMIQGGSMPMGPRGVIAIDEGHCPEWAKITFDSAEIHALDPTDAEVKELLNLIKADHARVIQNVRYMHVSTKVTGALLPDADKDEDEENAQKMQKCV